MIVTATQQMRYAFPDPYSCILNFGKVLNMLPSAQSSRT